MVRARNRSGARAVAVSIVLATAVLAVSACAPEPEPEPEVLTISDAGGRYLDAVCPVNASWDAVDVEVDRLRITVARGADASAEIDTGGFVEAITQLGLEIGAAEEALGDATVEWPKVARKPIAAVQASLADDAEQARLVADMSAADIATYSWKGADRLAASAQEARAALGLPDDPQAACDLR